MADFRYRCGSLSRTNPGNAEDCPHFCSSYRHSGNLTADKSAGRFAFGVAQVRSLVEQFDAKPAEIRRLLRGALDPACSRELLDEMRAAGLPT